MTRTAQASQLLVGNPEQERNGSPLLAASGLKKRFPIVEGSWRKRTNWVHAVDDVAFEIEQGETLGIVGESGCGKSTTARLLMNLIKPDEGSIVFDGKAVGNRPADIRNLRRNLQMVFQDSYASLNPRMTIENSVAFGLKAQGENAATTRKCVFEILTLVGLDPKNFAQRYPHELSGGQRQRVNLARALVINPRLLILDEAVSALDKSVEAQILNLLQHLKHTMRLTYIFISHDLNVVQYLSDRVLVMYLGKVVEVGPVESLYREPKHPYTQALLASRLSLTPGRRFAAPPVSGDPPSPINRPSGCVFRTRCLLAEDVCTRREPTMIDVGAKSHLTACHAYQLGSGHSRAASIDARDVVIEGQL
jgi:peptide/nickel transport system ATP-binding protein